MEAVVLTVCCPKHVGKLLWKGAEGWTAALRLLAVAEAAKCTSCTTEVVDLDRGLSSTEPLAWRRCVRGDYDTICLVTENLALKQLFLQLKFNSQAESARQMYYRSPAERKFG
jgi:hypothetical protein